MIYRLSQNSTSFPDPKYADENGLLAFGGDLGAKRLIAAYRQGIFPWPQQNLSLLWFSPNPRAVLYPDNFRLTRSLKRSLKRYEIKVDTNFEKVITMCGDRSGTWINSEMIEAYCELFRLGFAHSIESYDEKGELAGGLYGVCIGRVFCGESMFTVKKDASKAALYELCRIALKKGAIVDCQIINPHLLSLGAEEISRDKFLRILDSLGGESPIF
ncbi:MAG: leucyl/phenylalanyl-tRNA--protein transferase [Campylobacteraceae bacterium]|jgi:leucyl/phenylalanyl-tRNA--protein transferase|nr:leucyl/phenylalanyl-tRNA--protein transferase [Campylobacteraceae bacterium]